VNVTVNTTAPNESREWHLVDVSERKKKRQRE